MHRALETDSTGGTLRASPGLFNTDQDIEKLVDRSNCHGVEHGLMQSAIDRWFVYGELDGWTAGKTTLVQRRIAF